MSTLSGLLLLCAITGISLLTVSLINRREHQRRALKAEIGTMKRRIQRLEELVTEVDPLLEHRAIPRLLNDEVIDLVTRMRGAAPNTPYLDAIFQTALLRADTLADDRLPAGLDRLKESDAQIARAQRSLQETATILRSLRASDKITVAQLNNYRSELSWAYLMVETISQVGQGHKSVRRNNNFSARAFYKKAQSLLSHSAHRDPRRQQFIKELTEIIAGKRSSISVQLMPETHLNPEVSSPA